jgi:hypothetical protein
VEATGAKGRTPAVFAAAWGAPPFAMATNAPRASVLERGNAYREAGASKAY